MLESHSESLDMHLLSALSGLLSPVRKCRVSAFEVLKRLP